MISQQGLLRIFNEAGLQLLEADAPESVLGRPPSDFVHTMDKVRSSNRLRRASEPDQAGHPNKPSEFRICTCKGQLRMVLVSTVAITLDNEPALLMCAMDMTPERNPGATARNEQAFRRLFESMQDVYYRTDARAWCARETACAACWATSHTKSRPRRVVLPAAPTATLSRPPSWRKGEVMTFPARWYQGRHRDHISISSHALFDHHGNFAGVGHLPRCHPAQNLERNCNLPGTTDMLTGMANRRAFLERADPHQHARFGQPARYIDLDHSKASTTDSATWKATGCWQVRYPSRPIYAQRR
jgi:hypothetical protein